MLRKALSLLTVVYTMTLCSTLLAQVSDECKIIHAGTLLSNANEEAQIEQSIIVRNNLIIEVRGGYCLLYTSPSPRDKRQSRMPSSA